MIINKIQSRRQPGRNYYYLSDPSNAAFPVSSAVYLLDIKKLAGVLGFEPRYAGIKTLCLTAWRHPKIVLVLLSFYLSQELVAILRQFLNYVNNNTLDESKIILLIS